MLNFKISHAKAEVLRDPKVLQVGHKPPHYHYMASAIQATQLDPDDETDDEVEDPENPEESISANKMTGGMGSPR